MGVGNARAKLGKGVILILVASREGFIRQALAMRGRTVFATFKPVPELQHKGPCETSEGQPSSHPEPRRPPSARTRDLQIDQTAQRRAAPPSDESESAHQLRCPADSCAWDRQLLRSRQSSQS